MLMKHKNKVAVSTLFLAVSLGTAGYASMAQTERVTVPQERSLPGTPAGHGALRGLSPAQRTASIPSVQNLRAPAALPPMAAPGTVSAGIDLRGCNLAGESDRNIYSIPVSDGGEFQALGDLQYVMTCGYDDGKGHF